MIHVVHPGSGFETLLTGSRFVVKYQFFICVFPSALRKRFVQVLFVAKEHPCPLRDYMEAECKNLVGLVNRMKDRLVRAKKPLF
jgi:hypothetical protein